MKQKKSRKIFEEVELYKFCLGEVCGISVEEETGNRLGWSDYVDQELENKYNKLSDAGQNTFDRRLRKVAIKFKEAFDNLPQEIESEEDFINLEDEKDRLMYKIANELHEFLAE